MWWFEQLEQRIVFSDLLFGDVTGCIAGTPGGLITPQDVLVVINYLNLVGPGKVPATECRDVNFDGEVTAQGDVLPIINCLNERPNAAHVFNIHFGNTDTVGLTEEEFLESVDAAFDLYEQVGDVAFTTNPNEPRDILITTREVYVGNGVHAGGRASRGLVEIHNGQIGAFHHSCTRAACNESFELQVVTTVSLPPLTAHELGHLLVFGFGHSNNRNCIMWSGSVARDWCPAEVAAIERRFGSFGDPPPPDGQVDDLLFTP